MGKQRSKEQQAAYIRKLDTRKNRLIELSPPRLVEEAFQRVRQIYRDEPDTDMIAAYDRVIQEAEEATS